ncbi:S-layer homology domain-containing protein [Nitriliruptor alkaliphilus]|uniref:S-layer homology domain-containing protein n=1 Tax=Nitriliruptor alkaliphilus TaxID=427918 RepID=UPI001B80D932|nr:S-layer homology domain-containing protein [Nitriliruptor alkaliphilus]
MLRTATLTVVLLSVPAAALATHVFSDVPHSHPHAKGIGYVSEAGITQGCDGSRYCPGEGLTRAQMGTFLYRASGNDPDTPPSVNAARLQGQPASTFARKSDLPKVTTVTESVGCVGNSFFPLSTDVSYFTFNNHARYITGPGSSFRLDCQVTVPDGATLTAAAFRVSDTSTTQRVARVEVVRRTFLGLSPTTLASQENITTNAGTPGSSTVTLAIPPANAVVDNGTYGYTLGVAMGPSTPAASEYVSIVGATLTYEIDRLVP